MKAEYRINRNFNGTTVVLWTDLFFDSGEGSTTRVTVFIKNFTGRGAEKRAKDFVALLPEPRLHEMWQEAAYDK